MPGYKRSVINVQIPVWWEREFIWADLVRGSGGTPAGYPSQTDAQGYANSPSTPSKAGGVFALPRTFEYGGYYVVTGRGAGRISINAFNVQNWIDIRGATVTQNGVAYPGGYSYSSLGRGNFDVTDTGKGWRIIVQRTDRVTVGDWGSGGIWSVQSTNVGGRGYVRGLRIYRIDDEADVIAGKWYNRRWKQTLIDLDPCAIRFMTWTTGAGTLFRWRNRTPPTLFSNWGGTINFNMLQYGPAYFTSNDHTVYACDAVAGTPASYQHGEVVYCRVPGDFQTAGGTITNGTGIAAAGPDDLNPAHTKITTTTTKVYHVGDVLQFSFVTGMYRLDYMEGTVQTVGVEAPNNFTVDIDCRSFNLPEAWSRLTPYVTGKVALGSDGNVYYALVNTTGVDPTTDGGVHWANNGPTAFLSNKSIPAGNRSSGNISVQMTLNVGSRGAAPTRLYCGTVPASNFGHGYLYGGEGSTRPFWYDKNAIARRNQDGSVTFGVWWTADAPTAKEVPNNSMVGIEYCLKLINELDEMIVEQGLQETKGPINPWICVNCYGLLSTDPDYDPADHLGIGMCDVMLNGNPSLGIGGIPRRCDLFVEYSNETWNSPGGFYQYNCRISASRWGNENCGYNDHVDGTMLRAVQLVQDIKAAFPNEPRIKHIAAGHEVNDVNGINNHGRIYGSPRLFGDSAPTATIPPGAKPIYYGTAYGTKEPIRFFWGFATAPYMAPSPAWNDANLASGIPAWIANGQKKVQAVSKSFPAHVMTTTPHGFSNGDMVVFTNITWGTGEKANGLFDPMFGEISNVTSTTFDIALDTTELAVVNSANVTRINGTDQESVYRMYLQWMINHGHGGQDANGILSRCRNYCNALQPFGVHHVNYEGWEEMVAQQYVGAPYDNTRAFIGSCKRSQAMADMMTIVLNNKKSVYGSYMPSAFTQEDPGRWGFVFPDAYGFAVNGVEWSGLSKSWKAMCDYNAKAAMTTIKFIFRR